MEIFEDGKSITDHKNIQNSFHWFYISLLDELEKVDIEIIWSKLFPDGLVDLTCLKKKFGKEEIKDALF